MRLQFYPATLAIYTLGSIAAAGGVDLDLHAFALGLLAILALEVATVFTNEIYDFPSDVRNGNWSWLNGGSRTLVERRLSAADLWRGDTVALSIAAIAAAGLAIVAGTRAWVPLVAVAVLALGYTIPPLKLSHRMLGEIDVAITHSIGLLLCGYVFQGGSLAAPFPWLLSIPMGLSMLPSITLAGIPDQHADAAAGKRTIAVCFGCRRAAWCAIVATLAAAVAAVLATRWQATAAVAGWLPYFAIPHALLLVVLVFRYLSAGAVPRRIDGIIVAALGFGMWFGMVPLAALLLQ
jgi:1,4-dihydroxy-2-naphthoate polyprenyltransferase